MNAVPLSPTTQMMDQRISTNGAIFISCSLHIYVAAITTIITHDLASVWSRRSVGSAKFDQIRTLSRGVTDSLLKHFSIQCRVNYLIHHLVLKGEHSPFTVYLGFILAHCHLSFVGRVCCWVHSLVPILAPGILFSRLPDFQEGPKNTKGAKFIFANTLQIELESGWFLRRGKNQEEKILGVKGREPTTNSIQATLEASALIAAPSLLSI